MTTRGFVRRPRIAPPVVPGGNLDLVAPPEVPRQLPGNLLMKLMPVVMVIAVIGVIAMMAMMGRSLLSNPFMLMFPLMMLMSMIGMVAGYGSGGGTKAAAELNEERKDYFRYLAQTRREVHRTGQSQLEALRWSHPEPLDLQALTGTRRMWERRPTDPDFGHVRIGIGSHRLATRLARPETGPIEDLEPVSTVSLRRFVRTHGVVHGLPTAVSLRAFPAINIEGDPDRCRMLVRSMIMEFVALHGPDHATLAIICAEPDGPAWAWTKWLPHIHHPSLRDALGPVRMIYPSLAEFETAFASELAGRGRFMRGAPPSADHPQVLVVIDDGHVHGGEQVLSDAGFEAVTVLDLTAPADGLAVRRGLQLVVADESVAAKSGLGVEKFAVLDQVGSADAAAFARALAHYRIITAAQILDLGRDEPVAPGLMELLKIPDAARIDPGAVWRPRSGRERLRVRIGVTPDGSPVELDIKESAENGMGPHGLCIGATGSGKSEFLRTLVLALVTTHSPDLLNLVLVDFKGGATFLGVERLPHVAAVITNLEEELTLVDRMKDALSGELNRRQELLRAAGNFANVSQYEAARAAGAALDPLPALFVIVDEFSELLSQKPDFAELFVMIGRLGRSLRVHLLLASQRLEEGRLRGLESHLSYRIGLRTFSAAESRSVLGITDAYHLPSEPGSAYLKTDASDPIRFKASYVSGPYLHRDASQRRDGRTAVRLTPMPFTAAPVPESGGRSDRRARAGEAGRPELPPPPPGGGAEVPTDEHSGGVPDTLLQVVVRRLIGHGRPAHGVWLPPLDESPSVDMLLPQSDWRAPANCHGQLWLPIGVIDKPYEQRRDVLTVDLSGSAGHIAVVGGPQSGKSTTLRTIMMAAAVCHTPEQVQFYCLDFGGGTLSGMRGVPHVGSVAGRGDVERVRRTVAELTGLLRRREEDFRAQGIESVHEFRRRRADTTRSAAPDQHTGDPYGDVFLVIDGWSTIRAEFEPLESAVLALAKGLSYGVHVVVSASRWAEIRPNIKDLIGTRIELRLGDPSESEMNRRAAPSVPVGRPGRGLTGTSLQMLIALPRLDSSTDRDTLPDGVSAAGQELIGRYGDRRAPAVRLLDGVAELDRVVTSAHERGVVTSPTRVVIGIGENELAPVVLDFDAQPHFMVFGDVECGKTALLRTLIHGITVESDAERARVVLVDYRRTLLGVLEGEQLAGYSTSSETAAGMVAEVARYLRRRLPPDSVTPRQLRERSWWSGPEIFVVVDDYDLVAGGSGDPLLPLVELLPQARDLGFHLVVARRMGGIGRALYDNVLGRLRELSVDTLLMSGSRDEGKIIGEIRPSKLPPGRGVLVDRAGAELIQVAWTAEVG